MFVKYLNINELNIDEISKFVSSERIIRSEKYKAESDKKRSIAVEYLLNEMIREIFNNFSLPVLLKYDAKGKPHIYDADGETDLIHFSLSHSGDYVACMISNRPCGVDIERHSDRPYEKITKRVCSENELEVIKSTQEFFDLWTLKESVLKAVGLGLSLDMREFEMKRIDNNFFETKVGDDCYSGGVLEAPDGYSLSYVELDIIKQNRIRDASYGK